MIQKRLKDWLGHIESFHPDEIELGLDRILTVASQLKLLTNPGKLIIVGGTNGKGSCVATLEALAKTNNLKVLSYTSPHLIEFNERIRIDGNPVDDDMLVSAFEAIESVRGSTSLTFFEFTTLAALWVNQNVSPDLTVLEVGLGGRLDAVNIMQPDVSVITTIDRDHSDWLGDSLEQIAFEKGGITRANKNTLVGDKKSFDLLKNLTDYHEANFVLVDKAKAGEEEILLDSKANPFQLLEQNVLLAVQAFSTLFPKANSDLKKSLQNIKLSGRFQVISDDPLIVVDVAHNPQSARNLIQQVKRLKQQAQIKHVSLVCGMMKDKAISEVLKTLDSVANEWHFVDLDTARAANVQSLNDIYTDLGGKAPVYLHPSIESVFHSVKQTASKEQMILVFGSFITVGNMIQYINQR